MPAYIEATTQDIVDPKSPAGTRRSGVYVGQLLTISVEPTKSLALCFRVMRTRKGQYIDRECRLKVGDVVRFK